MRAPALLLPLALTALLALGCARQLQTGPQPVVDEAVVANAVSGVVRIDEFKGFGEITMASPAQKLAGKFDALRKNSGSFKANVYSPFGSTVASISANDFKGSVNVGKEQVDFTYDSPIEGVPFPCVKHFTYGNFVKVLTASMPDEFWELPATPNSLAQSKKKAKGKKRGGVTASWVSDSLTVRALIIPKTGNLESVTFDYVIDGSKLSMQFSRFRKGAPYEILIKEGAKNYISVNYETMTWK